MLQLLTCSIAVEESVVTACKEFKGFCSSFAARNFSVRDINSHSTSLLHTKELRNVIIYNDVSKTYSVYLSGVTVYLLVVSSGGGLRSQTTCGCPYLHHSVSTEVWPEDHHAGKLDCFKNRGTCSDIAMVNHSCSLWQMPWNLWKKVCVYTVTVVLWSPACLWTYTTFKLRQ